MNKIIISIFLVLSFLCAPVMSETAIDWYEKANALTAGNKKNAATVPVYIFKLFLQKR